MMKLYRYILSFAVAAFVAQPVQFAHGQIALANGHDLIWLDPSRTKIDFMLPGKLHNTYGRFALRQGSIDVNLYNGSAAGAITIDSASEDSSEALRDAIMKNGILEVQRYPEIVLFPQKVEGVRDSSGDLYGRMTGSIQLHSSVHPIGIEFHGHLSGDEFTATSSFLVPYVQWGVESPNVLTSQQIINATEGETGIGTRMFSSFAYLLPMLRKIPPNLFEVSDYVKVTVAASGRIIWAPEPAARQVTIIAPR
jgi:polyisoprenoid-binding protein YceI